MRSAGARQYNEVLATEIMCWMRYSRDPATITQRAHTTYETFGDADLVGMLRADEEEHADDIIDLLGASAS